MLVQTPYLRDWVFCRNDCSSRQKDYGEVIFSSGTCLRPVPAGHNETSWPRGSSVFSCTLLLDPRPRYLRANGEVYRDNPCEPDSRGDARGGLARGSGSKAVGHGRRDTWDSPN